MDKQFTLEEITKIIEAQMEEARKENRSEIKEYGLGPIERSFARGELYGLRTLKRTLEGSLKLPKSLQKG